jgi:hypothetical protein
MAKKATVMVLPFGWRRSQRAVVARESFGRVIGRLIHDFSSPHHAISVPSCGSGTSLYIRTELVASRLNVPILSRPLPSLLSEGVYLVAIGLDNRQISLHSWNCLSTSSPQWNLLAKLNQRFVLLFLYKFFYNFLKIFYFNEAHNLTVKRLKFRPFKGTAAVLLMKKSFNSLLLGRIIHLKSLIPNYFE